MEENNSGECSTGWFGQQITTSQHYQWLLYKLSIYVSFFKVKILYSISFPEGKEIRLLPFSFYHKKMISAGTERFLVESTMKRLIVVFKLEKV